jgi:lipopolysaccharide transport system ATP-binding protein
MDAASKEGRTVLFVSHNMGALLGLCSRAILLNQGKIVSEGPASDVVKQYTELGKETVGEIIWPDRAAAPGNEKIRLHAVRFTSGQVVTSDIDIDKELQIEIEFWNLREGKNVSLSIHLLDQTGVCVLASANMHSANLVRDDWFGKPHPVGLFKTTCTIPGNFLNVGRYSVHAIILTDLTNAEVVEKDVLSFNVHETGAMRKEYIGDWIGVIRPRLAWSTQLTQTGLVGEQT